VTQYLSCHFTFLSHQLFQDKDSQTSKNKQTNSQTKQKKEMDPQSKTRELRTEGLVALKRDAPALLAEFAAASLLPAVAAFPTAAAVPADPDALQGLKDYFRGKTVEAVEETLVRDPFTCTDCGAAPSGGLLSQTTTRACPVTGQPHRRRLVEIALRLLRLIAASRASAIVAPRSDPTPRILSPVAPAALAGEKANSEKTGAANGETRTVVRRTLPLHPHLLVLAFHEAAGPHNATPEADALSDAALAQLPVETLAAIAAARHQNAELQRAAVDVLVALYALSVAVAVPDLPDAALRKAALVFDRTWRGYLPLVMPPPPGTAPALTGAATAGGASEDTPTTAPLSSSSPIAVSGRAGVASPRSPPPPLPRGSAGHFPALDAAAAETHDDSPSAAAAKEAQDAALREILSSSAAGPSARASDSTAPAAASSSGAPLDSVKGAGAAAKSVRAHSEDRTSSPEEKSLKPAGLAPVAPLPKPLRNRVETDTDTDTEHAGAGAGAFGPELPPGWQVGADGKSHRPPQPSLQKLIEYKRRAEELAARKAVSARLRLRQPNVFAEDADLVLARALGDVSEQIESATFSAELRQRPPNLARVPQLLRAIVDTFVSLMPSPRLRAQLSAELRDVLDWDTLRFAVRNLETVGRTLAYIVEKICAYGAPAREEELRATLRDILARLPTEDISVVVPEAFSFLRTAIRRFADDIDDARIMMAQPQLAQNAAAMVRKYLDDWTAPPSEWIPSTRAWVARFVLSQRALILPTPPAGVTIQPIAWTALKQALVSGVRDLLRSSNRATNERWAEYPTELFLFEKPIVFSSANLVQLCVVRMMVVGTARMLLRSFIPRVTTIAAIGRFEARLDARLKEWLGGAGRMSIEELKTEVLGDIAYFLHTEAEDRKQAAAATATAAAGAGAAASPIAAPEVVALTAQQEQMLRGVMDQMIDPSSKVYATFETKLLGALEARIRMELDLRRTQRHPTSEEEAKGRALFQALGAPNIVTDANDCALDLADMIDLHVAVYAPRYEQILVGGAITADEGEGAATGPVASVAAVAAPA
jgi:hypothetical protein